MNVCRQPAQNSWRTWPDLPGLISLGSRAGLVLAFQYEVRDEIRDKYGGLQCLFGLHTYRFGTWPEQTETFPWVYTPDPDRPDFVDGRWETEDWGFDDATRSAYYLEKLLYYYKTCSPEVAEHFSTVQSAIPPMGEGITLSFVGDILPISNNHANFADGIVDVVNADYRVANLETPASPDHPVQNSGAPPKFNSPVKF